MPSHNHNDYLFGAGGNDELIGGDDNDTIEGGTGDDLLVGGAGADVFRFDVAAETGGTNYYDTISDFEDGTDMVSLVGFDPLVDTYRFDTSVTDGDTVLIVNETLTIEFEGSAASGATIDVNDLILM
ncbi:hypothetical protein KUV57_24820 [Epibacterium sp. DP7N7-1]|jgi:Ca2+-binding RTX toxin-like protein|nr:hypothetical protein [Epibacterium sp. DP7N7-1]